MFNIGLPEMLMIIAITFLVAPREIPKVMRKVGQLFAALARIRDELTSLERDVSDIVQEGLPKAEAPKRKPAAGPVEPDPQGRTPGPQPPDRLGPGGPDARL